MRGLFILIGYFHVITLLAQPNRAVFLALQEGLSNQQVLDIAHDESGFTWVATELGLNRFVGNTFQPYYASENQNGLSVNSNEINTLLYDDKKLYVGTRSNGLNVLDIQTNRFSYYIHDPRDPKSIATNDVTDLIKGAEGYIWLATYHQGIQRFDPIQEKFDRFNTRNTKGLPENSIWSMAQDGEGMLYIGHVREGLSIFDPNRSQVTRRFTSSNSGLPDNEVKALYCDRRNNIWIGTRKGLAVYNSVSKRLIPIPLSSVSKNREEPFVYTIKEVGNTVWIGAESSQVFVFEPVYAEKYTQADTGGLRMYDLGRGNSASVQQITVDRFGNAWLAVYGGGVGFVSHLEPFFQVFPSQSKGAGQLSAVSSIIPDRQGGVWLATEGTGLVQLQQEGVARQIFRKDELPDSYLLTAFVDSRQNVWMGLKRGGAATWTNERRKWEKIAFGEHVSEIRAFIEDTKGHLWMAAQQGVYIYDPVRKHIERILINQPMLGDYAPRTLVEDRAGNVWVGTYGQGLYVYDQNRRLIQRMASGQGLQSNTVNHLIRDSRDNIWIATNEGLALQRADRDLGHIEVFKPEGGDAWLFVNAVSEAKNGDIWCSTKLGLLRYRPEEQRFLHYDQAFGLPLGGFINGSVYQDRSGHMFFGMQEGVCHFHPEQVPLKLPGSPVRLIRLSVFGSGDLNRPSQRYPMFGQEVHLAPNENSFRVELAVMDHALHGLVDFSYKLEGVSKDWIFLGSETNLDFRAIPYGKHELRIRTRMKNGDWSKDDHCLSIIVSPPFYLSTAAQMIYTLLVGSIIFVLLFFYNKKIKVEAELRLKERQHAQDEQLYRERLDFYTNITHELRTPLTLILGPLDDLLHSGTLEAKQKASIGMVQKSANRLFSLVNQLLEFRKVESQYKSLTLGEGYLSEMLRDIVQKYAELNTKKGLDISLHVPENEEKMRFDAGIIHLIVDNLLSNAYKYTESGQIKVSLGYEADRGDSWAVIAIEDTGIGISEEFLTRIFDKFYRIPFQNVPGTGVGLALVKELAVIHQGQIDVESKEGRGSTFTFRFLAEPASGKQEQVSQYPDSNMYLGQRRLILLVEDDADLRTYLTEALQAHYDVVSVDNGRQACQTARDRVPDLIVSDIMMSGMDGFQLIEQLKEDRLTSHIPLILLTAKDTEYDRLKGYALGVDSYLTKPVSTRLLYQRIDNVLEKRKRIYEEVLRRMGNKENEVRATDSTEGDESWRENQFIQDFVRIVEEHMQDQMLDATMLAEKLNMSQSTLYRKLKGITGKNINQLVRKIRVRKAAELLKTGKYNVTEVSFMVGINSAIYFRQCFKEEFGMLPSTYQKSENLSS